MQMLEIQLEDLKQDVVFKQSAENLKLQMQVKVKEEYISHLKAEVVQLNIKLSQKFELLDMKVEHSDQDLLSQNKALETELIAAKTSIQEKDTEIQDLQS